jgi:hypothetical protein
MKMTGLATVFLLCACATPKQRAPINYELVDDIANESLMLYFTNTTNKAVCLNSNSWPSLHGVVDRGSESVLLHVGDRVFRIDQSNPGYCAGCATEVEPGQTIVGSFPYSRFQLPKEMYTARKELAMEVTPTKCK